MAAPTGVAVTLLPVRQAAERIVAGDFADGRVLLLVRGPLELAQLRAGGVPFDTVNVGNVGNVHSGPGRVKLTKEVHASVEELAVWRDLATAGVRLAAQWLPNRCKTDLSALVLNRRDWIRNVEREGRQPPMNGGRNSGRQPVREAPQHLAQDRFVELRRGRGAFVRVPTSQEIDGVLDVRSLLEVQTARLAARRITEPTLDGLREICATRAAAVAAGDKRKRISWFFSTIVIERSPRSWEQHEEIYAALAARDGGRAAESMVEHVAHTRARLDAEYQATQ